MLINTLTTEDESLEATNEIHEDVSLSGLLGNDRS